MGLLSALLGNASSFVTRGPDGQQQTTSPLGSSFQTRGNSGAAWSTSPLGSSFVTRGTATKKDEKTTRVLVIPGSK